MMIRMMLFLFIISPRIEALEGCFPDSSLRFGAHQKNATGLSEFATRSLIERFKMSLAPIVKRERQKKLIVNLEWSNDRVNAHCTLDDYDNPVVNILGGMVRHPEMTSDGLLLILCHELGHFMGGAPKKFRGNSTLLSWASVEGQADYFATSQCLPAIYANHYETKVLAVGADDKYEVASKRCGQESCVRSSLAGLAIARVFASMREGLEWPDLSKEDTSRAARTLQDHPKPQCRLDTYIAGANIEERPMCWFAP